MVHVCNLPAEYVPWPVCRVKLVGCPNNPNGDCAHWRFADGIEMTPTSDAYGAFSVGAPPLTYAATYQL